MNSRNNLEDFDTAKDPDWEEEVDGPETPAELGEFIDEDALDDDIEEDVHLRKTDDPLIHCLHCTHGGGKGYTRGDWFCFHIEKIIQNQITEPNEKWVCDDFTLDCPDPDCGACLEIIFGGNNTVIGWECPDCGISSKDPLWKDKLKITDPQTGAEIRVTPN